MLLFAQMHLLIHNPFSAIFFMKEIHIKKAFYEITIEEFTHSKFPTFQWYTLTCTFMSWLEWTPWHYWYQPLSLCNTCYDNTLSLWAWVILHQCSQSYPSISCHYSHSRDLLTTDCMKNTMLSKVKVLEN